MLGYNFRTWMVVLVVLSCIYGMIEFLGGTSNYERMVQTIRARKIHEHEVIRSSQELQHRSTTTTTIPSRRKIIEAELIPMPELDGKCTIDTVVVDMTRQTVTSTNNNTALTTTNNNNKTNIEVDYWFAISTTANTLDDLTLFILHQHIYAAIDASNIWCTSGATTTTTTTTTGNESSLLDMNNTAVSRLGVIHLLPTNLVASRNLFCQTEAFNSTSSEVTNTTKSANCFVMQGTIQIMAQSPSTSTLATYALHNELQNVVTAASLESPILKDVAVLSYVGNTAEDAVIFLTNLSPTSSQPPVGSINEVTSESPNEDNSQVAFVFLVIPLFLILLLSMFVVRRRSQLMKNGMNAIQSWEEYDPNSNVLRGTGDPPDSYHDGLYHYMNNGQQKYLSTRCALCLETKRNITGGLYAAALKCSTSASTSANNNKKHFRRNQDGNDEAYQMSRPRSDMRLGQYHMGMDVHVCQSATCLRCMGNTAPMFLPTGIVRHSKNISIPQHDNSTNENDEDNSSLSSSGTPTSQNSGGDNQSYETRSTYNRDTSKPIPRSPPKERRR